MRILVTNDDGMGAPGLNILSQIAQNLAETVVIAPATEQSGISHRITFDRSLKLHQINRNHFTVDGTPADCVRVALARISPDFDFVFSGINDGANLGTEIFCSGTAAAAREASFSGIPAIAFSQYRKKFKDPFDWEASGRLTSSLIGDLIDQPFPNHRWLNVNLPDVQNEAGCSDTENPKVIYCDPDRHPLPVKYSGDDNELELAFRYSDRPQNSKHDVEICFGGNVAVSRFDYPIGSS